MSIVVQHIRSKQYLARDGSWAKLHARPAVFQDAVAAIAHCIQRGLRSIRLVMNAGVDCKERYIYPFGGDPIIKAEKKKLREQMAEHRRLAQERRILLERMNSMWAEAKERKKKVPFKRKTIAEGE